MSIAKQIQFVNMIPAYNNGVANFPFEGVIATDYKFGAWNVQTPWAMEYYGSKSDEALSGFRRSNVRGYRFNATLTMDNSRENSKIRTNLLSKLASGYRRTAYTLLSIASSQNSTTIQLAGGSGFPTTDDIINNLYMYINSPTLTGTSHRIVDYNGATGVITLASTTFVPASAVLSIAVGIEHPTIVLFDIHGSATTFTDPDIVPCNVSNIDWVLSRNWTINTQPIVIQLESIELYQQIPDDYRLA